MGAQSMLADPDGGRSSFHLPWEVGSSLLASAAPGSWNTAESVQVGSGWDKVGACDRQPSFPATCPCLLAQLY
jgi:hypothetical protein